MARIPPGIFTIGQRCGNEEAAIGYAQELGLLPGPTPGQVQAFNQVHQQVQGRGAAQRIRQWEVCWKVAWWRFLHADRDPVFFDFVQEIKKVYPLHELPCACCVHHLFLASPTACYMCTVSLHICTIVRL